MLLEVSKLIGAKIAASDGHIGSISDVLFDDATWTIRWVVVDAGNWLSGREVLLPPSVLGHPNGTDSVFPVRLTKATIKDSPDIDTHRPVSRQFETSLYDYYGWSPYWGTGYYMGGYGIMGMTAGMTPMGRDPEVERRAEDLDRMQRDANEPHLRSANAVTGYHLHATDGNIGHLSDILVEEADWTIHLLVVDTSNWWMGKKVLISPRSASNINWTERLIQLDVSREMIKASPDYDPTQPTDRAFEDRMAAHYALVTAPLLPPKAA